MNNVTYVFWCIKGPWVNDKKMSLLTQHKSKHERGLWEAFCSHLIPAARPRERNHNQTHFDHKFLTFHSHLTLSYIYCINRHLKRVAVMLVLFVLINCLCVLMWYKACRLVGVTNPNEFASVAQPAGQLRWACIKYLLHWESSLALLDSFSGPPLLIYICMQSRYNVHTGQNYSRTISQELT